MEGRVAAVSDDRKVIPMRGYPFEGVPHPADERPAPDIDDTMAANPEEPTVAAAVIKYRAPDLAAVITERATWPWVSLRIGADRVEIVRARVGQLVVLTAPSGAGKSSLAIEFARRHAEDVGPAIYLSRELDHDEVGGRIVSQRCGCSWEDALTGKINPAEMARALALPRLVVLALDGATVGKLEHALAELRRDNPDAPVFIVVDYLQLLDGGGADERMRVAAIAESLRQLAQRLRAVILGVSQTSRASSRGLRDGELVGADTTTTGAESAQIERAASITIALGGMKPLADGSTSVDISIGKGRMGQGDQVRPAVHEGRTGAWSVMGPSVSGDERRAERSGERDGGRVKQATLAIGALLATVSTPLSRAQIRADLGIRRIDVTAACRALLADPTSGVVEVRGIRSGGSWPLWSRDMAARAGIDVVPTGAGSDQ